MEISWSLIADGVVAVLLIATLVYVRRFSVRLETIRAGRAEFEKLIADLTKSTDLAASHLNQFKTTAEAAGGDLLARVGRAQGMTVEFGQIGDDLKLLVERAENAANRLESAIGRARPNTIMGAAAPAPVAGPATPVVDFTDDEDDRKVSNLSALSGMR